MLECYKNLLSDDLTYLNLDRPYWNQNFINTAISNDRLFVILGDMNISAYMTTFSVYFNKRLLASNCHMNDTDLYTLVEDKQWTIGKLMEITKDVSVDDGIDGDSAGDIWGLTSNAKSHAYDGFVPAFDIDLTRVNDSSGKHTLMDSATQEKWLRRLTLWSATTGQTMSSS